jgi:Ca2+-binding EF-hand superfamily protein
MKIVFGVLFAVVVLTGGGAIAAAQDFPPPPPGGFGGQVQFRAQMPSFAELDKNKDKKISRDELPSQFPPQFFDRLDANHDGFIDEEEFNAIRRGGGVMMGGPRTGESLVKLLDANTDGKVSRDEFVKIETLFDVLDKDHDGQLNQEELSGFFRAVNEAQAQATGGVEVTNLFDKYDKNKDNKITADEMGNGKTFKALDLNKDGEVTRAEADAALKQLKKASDAKKAQPQPNP